MRAGQGALAGDGVRDGDGQGGGQLGQRVVGAGEVDAAAGEDDGPGRGARSEQPGGRLDVLRGGARTRAGRARGLDGGGDVGGVVLPDAVGDVLGDVEHDGAGPAAGGDRVGAAHQLGDAGADLHAQELLHRRTQQPHLLGLLRHPLARVAPVRVPDDRDHGRAGVGRLDEPGDEVGRAGPERRVADADAPRRAGVGVGGERRGALVVDQDVAQPEAADGVVHRQQLEAAHPEDRAAAVRRERARQGLATRAANGRGGAGGGVADAGRSVHLTC
jgi:hypothetical protein